MANSKVTKKPSASSGDNFFERVFKLKEHNTTIGIEVMAGLTTFMTMAYIIAVNPGMLAETQQVSFDAALIATVLSAAFATFLMAFLANYPFALAPGMGLNAYFVYTVIMGMGYTYAQALTAVLISGIVFIILTVTGLRQAIVKAIPNNLKAGIGAGIGLFIAFLGLKNAGIMVSDSATLLGLGDMTSAPVILAIVGLIVTAVLMYKNVKGSILIGMAITTVLAWITKVAPGPAGIVAWPNLGAWSSEALFKLSGFKTLGILGVVEVVFAFFFVDMFDTIGTLVGVAKRSNMLDKDGNLPKIDKAMLADAIGTCFGAAAGTPTVTTYVESASGVAAGGKTGLTALTVAVCFLVFGLFFSPIVAAVPGFATAPALIIVGVLMMQSIKDVDWSDFSEALPTFAAISFMPFTFSISNGIAFSFIFYSLVKLLSGKGKEVHWLMYVLSLAFVLKFAFL